MKINTLKIVLLSMGLIFGSGFNLAVAHTLSLDDFSDDQYLIDTGGNGEESVNSINLLSGTGLAHASRSFIGLANAATKRANLEILTIKHSQVVQVSNGPAAAGEAAILWNFDPTDFSLMATGLLLEVFDTEMSVDAEIIVNNSVSSGTQTLKEAGDFLFEFADFSNRSVFASVSSLRLNLSVPRGFDGGFRLSVIATPLTALPNVASVPLPSAYWFMGSALLGFLGISRKKYGNG